MVDLKLIISLLENGELKNTGLINQKTKQLAYGSLKSVIEHINLGLTNLFSRFNLKQNELVLHALPEVRYYYLRDNRIALASNMNRETYIERTDAVKDGINLVQVMEIFNELGSRISINDRNEIPYIQTSTYDCLNISSLNSAEKFYVIYKAKPKTIVLDSSFSLDDYKIDMPDAFIEPLLMFVASKIFRPMGANNSTANADKSYACYQQYEAQCLQLLQLGLASQCNDTVNKFTQNGWV